jgi:hypothetical protein
MLIGGVVEIFLGINAEGRSLEDIAAPLSVEGSPGSRLANVTGAPDPCGSIADGALEFHD